MIASSFVMSFLVPFCVFTRSPRQVRVQVCTRFSHSISLLRIGRQAGSANLFDLKHTCGPPDFGMPATPHFIARHLRAEIETIYQSYQVLLLKAERPEKVYFAGALAGSGGAAGLTNFASSTGTFSFTSLIWIVNRPPGRASVHP